MLYTDFDPNKCVRADSLLLSRKRRFSPEKQCCFVCQQMLLCVLTDVVICANRCCYVFRQICYMCRQMLLRVSKDVVMCIDRCCYVCRQMLLHLSTDVVMCVNRCYVCRHMSLCLSTNFMLCVLTHVVMCVERCCYVCRQMLLCVSTDAGREGEQGETTDIVDDCGLRFLLAARHYIYMQNTMPMRQRAQLLQQGLSPANVVWAFHSEAEQVSSTVTLLFSQRCVTLSLTDRAGQFNGHSLIQPTIPSYQRGAPMWSEMFLCVCC